MGQEPSDVTAPSTSAGEWIFLRGPLTSGQILDVTRAVAARHGLTLGQVTNRVAYLFETAGTASVAVRWRFLPPQRPDTLGYQLSSPSVAEVLVQAGHRNNDDVTRDLTEALRATALTYTQAELDGITDSMPLIRRYSNPDSAFDDWALIFRDHYLEHSVGFLLGVERAGMSARWIYALDKGDRTRNRDRVHATFLVRGYRSDLLDNAAINDPAVRAADLERVTANLNAFIDAAHADGRRVLVVDDGGLLALGYGAADASRRVDAALELTVSGLKRIASAPSPLGIPVLNMARSQVKTRLGYLEIADSCLRRLRAILPDRKFIGRQILLIGYGTLGSRLASALRALGCCVEVVDTDLLALITAAEAGYPTYRTVVDALRASHPFMVLGTTGEISLIKQDLDLLPDGVYLAPFATRDFSILAEPAYTASRTEIPGVGWHYRLSGCRTAVLLGDGRSMNLFEADSIPNQGYDAYRAGTLIVAKYLCAAPHRVPAGLHLSVVDKVTAEAGLFEAYYDLYFAHRTHESASVGITTCERSALNACVVGYGAAGRLHTRILSELGAQVIVIDPKHQDLPKIHRSFPLEVGDLPATLAAGIDLWSICCPTGEHLPVLRTVLARNPAARILLEKPACQAHEIAAFTDLLAGYTDVRIVINDQYRHTVTLSALSELIHRYEPSAPISQVTVSFTKDRIPDITAGRFVDRSYGVLGYEWLHMLTVLVRILPPAAFAAYLHTDPASAELWAVYDPQLFIAALTERVIVNQGQDEHLCLELTSSVLGPRILVGADPVHRPPWRRAIRSFDDRHRRVAVHSGSTRFVLHLDPVTTPGGWQLDRNQHRLTAECGGRVLYDEVLQDSPLDAAVRHSTVTLLGDTPLPPLDLAPLRRIAAVADFLRERAPGQARSNTTESQSRSS